MFSIVSVLLGLVVAGADPAPPIAFNPDGPWVVLGKPTIRGSMPAYMARAAIRKRLGNIQACYRKELGERPGSSMDMIAKIVIGADGMVKHVGLQSAEEESVLGRCVKDEISRMRFPSTCAGITVIDQPFRFLPPRTPPGEVGLEADRVLVGGERFTAPEPGGMDTLAEKMTGWEDALAVAGRPGGVLRVRIDRQSTYASLCRLAYAAGLAGIRRLRVESGRTAIGFALPPIGRCNGCVADLADIPTYRAKLDEGVRRSVVGVIGYRKQEDRPPDGSLSSSQLNLTLLIDAAGGVSVAGRGGVLSPEDGRSDGPTIAGKEGRPDTKALRALLARIKKEFPSESRLYLAATETGVKAATVLDVAAACQRGDGDRGLFKRFLLAVLP